MAFVGSISSYKNGVQRRSVTCAAVEREAIARKIAGVAVSTTVGLATVFGGADASLAALFHFSGTAPAFLGPVAGRYLSACPSTPNCISTGSDAYSSSYVPPWTYHPGGNTQKSQAEAIADLKKVISEYPGATIVEERKVKNDFGEGYYIHAEFESKLMGFVDDFEALFQPEKVGTVGYEKGSGIVDYRSASRLGEGDFKANRNRIKAIRVALQPSGWQSIGFR